MKDLNSIWLNLKNINSSKLLQMKYVIRFSTLVIFWSDWINLSKMDKNGSKWIKMNQTWSNWFSDEIIIEIYHQIFNFIYFLIRLNLICPKGIKMDQTWSNWISDEIIIEIYHQIFNFIYFLIRLNQICPKYIKMDQNGSNLIKLDFWWNNHWYISSDFQFYLSFDQIESDLSNIIKFACFSVLSLSVFLVINCFDNSW